jgi:hypothetical protein
LRPALKVGLVAALLLAACSSAPVASSDPSAIDPADARLHACEAGPEPSHQVSAAFAVDEARHISTRIPALGSAPELQTDDPAIVVIIPGPVTIASWGGSSRQSRNAVCVLIHGEPIYYLDVDLTGAT